MNEWQDRVVLEHSELSKKVEKLREFLDGQMKTVACDRIGKSDFELLRQQLECMEAYCEILDKRMARFSEKADMGIPISIIH